MFHMFLSRADLRRRSSEAAAPVSRNAWRTAVNAGNATLANSMGSKLIPRQPGAGNEKIGAAGVDAEAAKTGLSRRKIVVATSGESSRED
jgi:hypothetical protein